MYSRCPLIPYIQLLRATLPAHHPALGISLDNASADSGVKGRSPFLGLPYYDWIESHLVEYMHIQSNVWRDTADILVGVDLDAGCLQAMRDLHWMPEVTREVGPSYAHSEFTPRIRKEVMKWVKNFKVPRSWCRQAHLLFKRTCPKCYTCICMYTNCQLVVQRVSIGIHRVYTCCMNCAYWCTRMHAGYI